MSRTRLVAIIPARGGSKSIPNKNMTLVAGRPLIDYTITVAMESDFDEVIVSTDNHRIAEFAKSSGCLVRERPANISHDQSRVVDAVLDVAENCGLSAGTHIMVLQPTSPLREAHHVREAIALLPNESSAAVVSVVECEHHPFKSVEIQDHKFAPTNNFAALEMSRQTLPRRFRPNGAIYFAPLQLTRKSASLVPVGSVAYEMSREASLDIDDQFDLQMAETLLRLRK